MEQFLTVKEFSERFKFAEQTVYNLINRKVFVLNRHYYKPRPKKILFKLSAIEAWVQGASDLDDKASLEESVELNTHAENFGDNPVQSKPKSFIKI